VLQSVLKKCIWYFY